MHTCRHHHPHQRVTNKKERKRKDVSPIYYPNSGTALASAGVPTGARHHDHSTSSLSPLRASAQGTAAARRIRADGRARPAQLHCGRREPRLHLRVG
ncbi:hypothetical protein C8Q80DRAFT_1143040 [Daedaleopsis nitida]|nr:hypothetical protein C8Q80DRAFT_1143040 [Daedaleopsis nitida]